MQTIIEISIYVILAMLITYCHVQFIGYMIEIRREKEKNEKICTPFNSTINEYNAQKK